jgi:hypothetical protein
MGGAAIYLSDYSVLECYNCTFLENDVNCSSKGGVGGAIGLDNFAAIAACNNCIFKDNKARSGGAVRLTKNSRFSNC